MKITLGVRKYLKISRLRRSLSLRTISRLSLKNLVFSPFAKDFPQIVGFAKLWRTPPHPPGGFGTGSLYHRFLSISEPYGFSYF